MEKCIDLYPFSSELIDKCKNIIEIQNIVFDFQKQTINITYMQGQKTTHINITFETARDIEFLNVSKLNNILN